MTIKTDARGECYDGEWQLVSDDGYGTRRWIMAIDENTMIQKTETYIPSLLAEENAKLLAANEGKRWGDGQVFARVPLHIKMKELAEPTRQHDEKWLKKWYNDPDNRQWRIFPGKV
jgi:hypothetical protein